MRLEKTIRSTASASTTGPLPLPRAKFVSMGIAKRKPVLPDDGAIAPPLRCWERQAQRQKPPAWRCIRRTLFPTDRPRNRGVPDLCQGQIGRKSGTA